MKSLILIIVSMIFVLPVYSQANFEEVDIVKIADVKFPNGASNIAPGTKRLSSNNTTYQISERAHAVMIGDIFMQVNGATGTGDPNYLTTMENSLKSLERSLSIKSNKTYINKTINNYQLLLVEDLNPMENGQGGIYTFFCLSNNHKSGISGTIEFPLKERMRAKNELDKLLASIYFK